MAMMASNSHAEGSSGGVPTENGLVALALNLSSARCQRIETFRQGAVGWLHQSLDQVNKPQSTDPVKHWVSKCA
ncbi:hypothetical protein J1N35_043868 [Gossypium stocksii]|uniref:Uncharacterized protein n=1 Tax=Gossypium stocksii TaxID=47602 RepID=A0A9D3U8A2_9ROSI|nr:hypothetical protein J1N35_043868 [Gossypium stocksii]